VNKDYSRDSASEPVKDDEFDPLRPEVPTKSMQVSQPFKELRDGLRNLSNQHPINFKDFCDICSVLLRTGETAKFLDVSNDDDAVLFTHWLAFLQSDEPTARYGSSRGHWQSLTILVQEAQTQSESSELADAENVDPGNPPKEDAGFDFPTDRSDYIAELLRQTTPDSRYGAIRETLKNPQKSPYRWQFYQYHFFNWFVRRYELRHAWTVFGVKHLNRGFPACLGGCSIVLTALLLGLFSLAGNPPSGDSWYIWAIPILILLFHGAVLRRVSVIDKYMPFYFRLVTTVPRLGVSVAVGYLFICSASFLTGHVNPVPKTSPETLYSFGAGLRAPLPEPVTGNSFVFTLTEVLVIVGATYGYLCLEISKRVTPAPDIKKVLRLACRLLMISAGYAAIGLPAACNLLNVQLLSFSLSEFLKAISFAAMAMAIGVFLQIAWLDQPATEPL